MKDSHDKALVTTRRDFGRKSIQTLLTVSLLEHLCSGNLLAREARLTTEKWLNQVNEIGLSMKGQNVQLPWLRYISSTEPKISKSWESRLW